MRIKARIKMKMDDAEERLEIAAKKFFKRLGFWCLVRLHPKATELVFPLLLKKSREDFLEEVVYQNDPWGKHLGVDCDALPGAVVRAIGNGVVVAIDKQPGSPEHPGWGTLVVIAHRDNRREGKIFFSLYGHLNNIQVKVTEPVDIGKTIGYVAPAGPENGYWERDPHLHFAIYTGPFPILNCHGSMRMLPGYFCPPTAMYAKLYWWENPDDFIAKYNHSA